MAKIEKQVDTEHYQFQRYITLKRWMSYFYQVNEIVARQPRTVLEIGPGAGMLGAFVRQMGVAYASVDVDPELRPDIVGTVLEIPVEDGAYDVACCFQVLEHLPYENFKAAILELSRVSADAVILSLPDAKPVRPFSVWIPTRGAARFLLPSPFYIPPVHTFNGEHYWEIAKRGYPLRRLLEDIRSCGLRVAKNYRSWGNPYHRFFVLTKR